MVSGAFFGLLGPGGNAKEFDRVGVLLDRVGASADDCDIAPNVSDGRSNTVDGRVMRASFPELESDAQRRAPSVGRECGQNVLPRQVERDSQTGSFASVVCGDALAPSLLMGSLLTVRAAVGFSASLKHGGDGALSVLSSCAYALLAFTAINEVAGTLTNLREGCNGFLRPALFADLGCRGGRVTEADARRFIAGVVRSSLALPPFTHVGGVLSAGGGHRSVPSL
jgi:hypothetical protein